MPGVTGVWTLAPSDLHLMMWVTARGFDERAFHDRQAVYAAIHRFIDEHVEALRASEFAFDHSVLVDDLELGDPLIPDEAEPVAGPLGLHPAAHPVPRSTRDHQGRVPVTPLPP
jgi:hypothetical protein